MASATGPQGGLWTSNEFGQIDLGIVESREWTALLGCDSINSVVGLRHVSELVRIRLRTHGRFIADRGMQSAGVADVVDEGSDFALGIVAALTLSPRHCSPAALAKLAEHDYSRLGLLHAARRGSQVGSRPSSRRAPIRRRNVTHKLTRGLDQPLITLKSRFNVS
jgi:hypothetical protein